MNITPPIGRIMDTSAQPCGFSPGDTDATTCMEPATWHICWTATGENGLACDQHMATAKQFAYADRHPVGIDCAKPGSTWFFEEKRCACPGTETTDVVHAAVSLPGAPA